MNINGLPELYRVCGLHSNLKPVEKTAESTCQKQQDAVAISSQGAFRSQLACAVRDLAQQFNEPVSTQRLEELRAEYASDACPLDAAEIADSILFNVKGWAL